MLHPPCKLLIFCVLAACQQLPGQVFQHPFEGAMSLGLAGATVAFASPDFGFSNEAILGKCKKTSVQIGASIPFGLTEWQSASALGIQPLGGNGAFGLSIAHAGMDIFNEQKIRTAYGRQFGERTFFGASFDFLRVSTAEYGRLGGATFGLGFLLEPWKNLSLGGQVYNPISLKISDFDLPSRYRFGFSWKPSEAFLTLVEAEKESVRPASLKFGFQYLPSKILAARIGVRTAPVRMSFGAGIHFKKGVALDFASEWHPVLGITPAAGLRWTRL